MNKKRMAAVLAGVVALAGGMAVAADAVDRRAERAKQYITWKVDDALSEIDANDAQRRTAHALKDQLVDEGLKLRATKDSVRAGLVEQWKQDRPDANTVHALVDQMLDGVRGFAHKAADAAISFHQSLEPAQRQELLKRYQERSARWER